MFKPSDKQMTPSTCLQYCKRISKPRRVLRSMSLPSDLLTLRLAASVGSLYLSDKLPDEQL